MGHANDWISSGSIVVAGRFVCGELAGVAWADARWDNDGEEPAAEVVGDGKREMENGPARSGKFDADRLGRQDFYHAGNRERGQAAVDVLRPKRWKAALGERRPVRR